MNDEGQVIDSSTPDEPEGEGAQDAPEADAMTLQREELEEALREKEQFRKMAQRSQADLANFKRRAIEELDEVRRTTRAKLLLDLLSIADDLDRAISSIPEDAVVPGWLDGLCLVQRNVTHVLETEGVSKIEAVGKPFEPWEFEAVQFEESNDANEGEVLKVIRDGYRHQGKILRAAQVIVAKRPESQVQQETTEEETQ